MLVFHIFCYFFVAIMPVLVIYLAYYKVFGMLAQVFKKKHAMCKPLGGGCY